MSVSPHVDLLALTGEIVDIPSVSRDEAALVDWLEHRLRAVSWLEVTRVGDNVVARTTFGRAQRLVLAGHTDTVPPHPGEERATVVGDRCLGVGSADMKSGLAVMLALAEHRADPGVDLTFVFYAREEIAAVESGLGELFDVRPDLLTGDAALLGEPTDGWVEAGCQGSMRLAVRLRGERAHTARPWMGRNAVHRLGALLALVEAHEPRRPVIDGCEYREALQAVFVEGGVAANVVPDHASVTLNHRFAPDRTPDQARQAVVDVIAPVLDDGDEVEVLDAAAGAPPGLDHPLLRGLLDAGVPVRAKLGWTDVARFAAHGIPAANIGPGDPELAHTAGEVVGRAPIDAVWRALDALIGRA